MSEPLYPQVFERVPGLSESPESAGVARNDLPSMHPICVHLYLLYRLFYLPFGIYRALFQIISPGVSIELTVCFMV